MTAQDAWGLTFVVLLLAAFLYGMYRVHDLAKGAVPHKLPPPDLPDPPSLAPPTRGPYPYRDAAEITTLPLPPKDAPIGAYINGHPVAKRILTAYPVINATDEVLTLCNPKTGESVSFAVPHRP